MSKYTVTIVVQQATNPEQTIGILSLVAGEYVDEKGNKYGLHTLPVLIEQLMVEGPHAQWRERYGFHATRKPHREPREADLISVFEFSKTAQGHAFWNKLSQIIKIKVRENTEKTNETEAN